MGRSPGFGSTLTDMSCDSALLRLGFPAAPGRLALNLPANVTRRFILQKARRHPAPRGIGLRLLVGDWFQVLFHSPPGVLFTFPSRYWFAIGGQEYLALEGGPPRFPQGFSCPGVLGWQTSASRPSATGLSPSLAALSNAVHVDGRFLTDCRHCHTCCLLPQPLPGNAGRLGTG